MNLNKLYLGFFLFLLAIVGLKANAMCYKSKTCIHNGIEKCGVDKDDKLRRFLDSCDILEYNCLKGTEFKKTSLDRCASLPPLDDPQEGDQDGGDESPSKEDKMSDTE